jgi:Kdo2-lipid IVA lauroyltransferase/acyltransferase
MAKPRNRLLDFLAYILFRALAGLVLITPVRVLYAVARGLGDVAYLLDRRHRRLAIEQIARSFPDWPAQQVRRVARQSLRSIVKLAIETVITPRQITLTTWWKRLRLNNIAPILAMQLERPGGMILVTGHYGNWEVGGFALARLGMPVVAIARPLDNPYLDRYIRSVRESAGLRIVDKGGASAAAEEVLAGGGWVCFVADQDAGKRGVFVDFFGRPASTYRSIALLALHYQVPIVIGCANRLADNFTFEVIARRTILPADWAGQDDEVRWITQEYTRELEAVVRENPGQYFGWAHRRWKHAPKT